MIPPFFTIAFETLVFFSFVSSVSSVSILRRHLLGCLQPWFFDRDESSNRIYHIDNPVVPYSFTYSHSMALSSFSFEHQPSPDRGSPFDDMPSEILDLVAKRVHGVKDIKNFELVCKSFYYSLGVTLIRNIHRLCLVDGDRVSPNLTLLEPPSEQCAASIIATNGCSYIESLTVTGTRMTLGGAHLIASIVTQIKLRHLSLPDCDMNDEMLAVILSALDRSKLTSLNLQMNRISGVGAKAIAAILPDSKLTLLNFGENEIGTNGTAAIANALVRSQLTSLSLGGNSLGASGFLMILRVLYFTKLETLDFRYNWIDSNDVDAITDFLGAISDDAPISQLKSLDLSGNSFDSHGALMISALVSKSSLTSLSVAECMIDAEGAFAIAMVLPQSKLTSLNIDGNLLGSDGAGFIVRQATESELVHLDLGSNNIDEIGAKHIAQWLGGSKLTSLLLQRNEMLLSGIEDLISHLHRSSVRLLDIRNNLLDCEDEDTLKYKVRMMRAKNSGFNCRIEGLDK